MTFLMLPLCSLNHLLLPAIPNPCNDYVLHPYTFDILKILYKENHTVCKHFDSIYIIRYSQQEMLVKGHMEAFITVFANFCYSK